MFSFRRTAILALGCALLMSGCGGGKSGTEGAATVAASSAESSGAPDSRKVLNLYIWSDYLAPNALPDFERQTGIKVHVSYFDTNETLETRLLAGHSGFDVVVPTASYFERMIKALLPDAPVDSWRMVFDPAVASKIAKCGISVLDSPAEMVRVVLSYLGRDPNSQKAEDLAAGEAALTKIRPYIRNI